MNQYSLDDYSQDENLPSIKEPFFHDLVHHLSAIEKLTINLQKIRYPLFGYSVPKNQLDSYEQMREDFLNLISFVPTIESLYPSANFSVFIQAFLHGVSIYLKRTDNCNRDSDDALNSCIDHINAYLVRPAVKRRSYQPNEKYRNHRKQISQYIDRLFDSYGRVLVLRQDFHYRVGIFPSMTRIKRDRDSLIRYLRDQQLGFIGFIWRLEYGIDKGYHLHTVILLDANQVQRDIRLGYAIGAHWKDVITNGQGTHYNCNACKHDYRNLGIGKIHWDDSERRANFESAVLYLAKADPLLEIARILEVKYLNTEGYYDLSNKVENSRVFGLSQLNEIRGVRLGRPRGR